MSRRSRYFIPGADRKLGERYELLECLGDGSYGWVWKAQRLEDNAIVAIKIPKAQGSSNSELAEGESLLNQKTHPNVVSVFWMGRVPPEREWYAIEMEYFPSCTLARLLDEGEHGFAASYWKVLDIYYQILLGVKYLHSLGMSHGDIKPQNILVSGDEVKLTDFGSSLLPEEIYTRTRENGGTVLYSAPEFSGVIHKQKDPKRIFKGDIYSLGVLLYHLVTSRLPHDTLSQVIRHTPFPRPREINSSISAPLEDFILRCLELEPSNRWDSIDLMLQEFSKVRQAQLNYQPVQFIFNPTKPQRDWSSQAVDFLEKHEYEQAESVAAAEFDESEDINAFRLMVSAAFKDERYYDCLKYIESQSELIKASSSIKKDLQRIALRSYLETRQLNKAETTLSKCLQEDKDSLHLLLLKASILGAKAHYEEASEILIQLNRKHPNNPAILKRLALVFEQIRDISKARAFLQAYSKLLPDDLWARTKIAVYAQLSR